MSVLLRKQYSTIKKEKLSEQAKSVLKSMYDTTDGFKDAKATRKIKPKFEAFYNKLKESKPEAIVGTKAKSKAAPKKSADDFKAARARRKPQTGVPKDKKSVDKDATRPAISKRGRRVSKAGNTYYEYRENRLDKNPSKYPMLAMGGYTNVDFRNGNWVVKAWQTKEDYENGNAQEVGKFKNIHDAHLLVDDYLSPNKFEWYAAEIYDGNDGETLYNSEDDGYTEMAEGGYMAKGGNINYTKKWKVFGYTIQGKNFVKEITLGRMSDRNDVMNALKRMSDTQIREVTSIQEVMAKGGYMAKGGELENLLKEQEELEFQLTDIKLGSDLNTDEGVDKYRKLVAPVRAKLNEIDKKLEALGYEPYAKGGYMADGGETHRLDSIFEEGGEIAEGNLEMAISNVKAIEHHAQELKSILDENTSIEAWVVAKLERAETDLSDVTHYIDGLSSEKAESDTYFADGGEMPFVWKRKYGFSLGQKVICNGEVDEIVGFVTSDDEENYNMGYRLILKENGTQSLGSVEKYAKGGETNYLKKWRVKGIDMQGRMFKKEITLGRMSDKNDVKYALKRMPDNNIREVTLIEEIKEDGGMMAKGGRLSRKQKQLDLNKNGKLDSQDFKMLRAGRKNARKK